MRVKDLDKKTKRLIVETAVVIVSVSCENGVVADSYKPVIAGMADKLGIDIDYLADLADKSDEGSLLTSGLDDLIIEAQHALFREAAAAGEPEVVFIVPGNDETH